MNSPRSAGYQVLLTALLSLNFGLVLFDRNALGFLMPFIQPELALSNAQVGVLSGALSLTWAVAAFGVGAISDRLGTRKQLLVIITLAFSALTFATGLAKSFASMLGARLLMGAAEGGIMPISQSLIAADVSARHRGLAMGVAQGFGSSLLGSFVAPVVLVGFAHAFGWRHAFFLAGAPGLLSALLMAWIIREGRPGQPASAAAAPDAQSTSLREVLADRNVVLCAVLGVLLVSYLVLCWTFMPLYLTQVRGYDPKTMSWLMGTLGISATLASTAIPALSDRLGRRPPMILTPLIAILLPLAALIFTGSAWGLALIFFTGWSVTGIFPLFMATVPSESVPTRHLATALGICRGTSEIIGGVLSPMVAGVAADRFGLGAPLWMMLALALVAALVALGLRESAPLKVVLASVFLLTSQRRHIRRHQDQAYLQGMSSVANSMAMPPPRASGPRIAARCRYCSNEVMRCVDSQTSMKVPADEVREFTATQARSTAWR
jgi:MFS transporter, ACS family, hexuronate transporter